MMPPWQDIDTVMFDMDGTLLDLHFDNYFWQSFLPQMLSESKAIHLQQAKERLDGLYKKLRGSLNWYCLDYWADELQMDVARLKHDVKHKIAVRPNVTELLEKLAKLDKHILLITNAHPQSLNLKLEHTGIGKYFSQTISSHSLGLAKENHGFWAKLMVSHPYDPQRTLLIDDSLPVLQQAEREGIRYLYGIHQPDSQKEPELLEQYPQIVDFEHILPVQPIHIPAVQRR